MKYNSAPLKKNQNEWRVGVKKTGKRNNIILFLCIFVLQCHYKEIK